MTANLNKKFGLNLDEEKDAFLVYLNKRVRNNRKKLDQIDELTKRDRTTLKPEQLEKLNSKNEVKENVKYIENIRYMYYEAQKAAKDEGKIGGTTEETTTTQKEETPQIETKEEVPQKVVSGPSETERQQELARITRENLARTLNLVHVAQFFRDQSRVQEYRQQASESIPDFDLFYDFYGKIFTFSESDKFVKIDDKINGALHELENYINQVDQPALRNRTYKNLQGVVETIAHTSFFRNHKADVAVAKTVAQIESSAIGSELKKPQHQPERIETPVEQTQVKSTPVKVTQEKLRSPEKETRAPVEQTKPTTQTEEARKDWGALEDEEDDQEEEYEGEEQEEEQAAPEEQKKTDDGWATVKPKFEKKPEGTGNFRGGNRPYRGGRGGQRGERKPRPEGEERREGETGGYRGQRPRRQYGEGNEETKEGQEGQEGGEQQQQRGGYRGQGRGGYRGQGRGGYRGGNREGGEGGYRGGNREGGEGGYRGGNREGGEGGYRGGQGGQRGGPRREYVQKPQTEKTEAPAS